MLSAGEGPWHFCRKQRNAQVLLGKRSDCMSDRQGLTLHFRTLASIDNLLGIDGVFVHLLCDDLSIFSDQEVDAAGSLIFVLIDSVLVGDFAAPIAQQREGDSNLVGKSF